MRLKALFIISILLMFGISAANVSAGADASYYGIVSPDGPTYQLVFIQPPNCMGQSSFTAIYDVVQVNVDTLTEYIFTMGSENFFAVFYLYEGSFNPASPTLNCIAADNTYPFEIVKTLDPAKNYFIVVTDDKMAQQGGEYSILAEAVGAGNIIFGGVETPPEEEVIVPPGESPCRYQMAAGAVLRSVPAATTAYFSPDLGSATTFSLPAGQWYVTDTSGEFSEVWITCRANPIWVLTSALG